MKYLIRIAIVVLAPLLELASIALSRETMNYHRIEPVSDRDGNASRGQNSGPGNPAESGSRH
jgi:hypothetical protein